MKHIDQAKVTEFVSCLSGLSASELSRLLPYAIEYNGLSYSLDIGPMPYTDHNPGGVCYTRANGKYLWGSIKEDRIFSYHDISINNALFRVALDLYMDGLLDYILPSESRK